MKYMKKRMFAMLLLFSLALTLIACKSKYEYCVMEIGGYDYISEANHKDEFRTGFDSAVDEKLPQERIINYGGNEYDVNYEFTKKGYLYNGEVIRYSKIVEGKSLVEFSINKTTSRIDSYAWFDEDYLETPGLIEKSRDECLIIAKDFVASLIDDPGEYELCDEKFLEIQELKGMHRFLFVRMIDGVRTADSIAVEVTVYGTVMSYYAELFGEMRDASLPDQEKMTAIQADVDKKLDAIYEPIKDDYSVTFELDDMVFERLADGRYALEYYYTAELISLKDENPITRHEMTRLIVILENN